MLPTVAERLAEAKLAYHQMMMGQSVVEVRDSNGESVRYARSDAGRLKAYIAELTAELAGTTCRKPFRPVFG